MNALSARFNVFSIEFTESQGSVAKIELPLAGERLVPVTSYREGAIARDGTGTDSRARVKKIIRRLFRSIFRDRLFVARKRKELRDAIDSFGVKFDVVITSSDPVGVHWQYIRAKPKASPSLHRAIYWQYWGDPLVGDVNHSAVFLLRALEKYLLTHGEKIFWVSSATHEEKCHAYPELSEKFIYLPRMIEFIECKSSAVTIDVGKPLRIVYAGDFFARSRSIVPLIQVIAQYPQHSLIIVGNGDIPKNIPANVRIGPRVRKNECDALIRSADIVVVVANSKGTQIPGKIFELAPTAKFVLVLDHNDFGKNNFPFKERFWFCENSIEPVNAFFSGSNYECRHCPDEYREGANALNNVAGSIEMTVSPRG